MQHIVVQNTEDFQKNRNNRNKAFSQVLSVDTVTTDAGVKGAMEAFKTFKGWVKNISDGDTSTKERADKMLYRSAAEFDELATAAATDKEKSLDFHGTIVAQSMTIGSSFMLNRTSGLMEKRGLISKGGGTEATGLIAGAVGSILSYNVSNTEMIDTGWMDLFAIQDMTGISSGVIINLTNHVRAQKLEEGEEVKAGKPLISKTMEETTYNRYGIGLAFSGIDAVLSAYMNSVGGVNGLFRAFRLEMARTKTKEAYRAITKKPTAKYIYNGKQLVNEPLGFASSYKDFAAYRTDRFIMNLQEAYRTFIKQAIEDGQVIDSPMPTVHCVYNPYAQGADVIQAVMNRLNNTNEQYVLSLPIVFHPSIIAPECGAWVEKVVDDVVMRDSLGFEIQDPAETEQAFGFMLVLPQGSNLHGINMELKNATMEYAPTETETYFAFERWTTHAGKGRRFWVKNAVPVWETTTEPIAE